MLFAFYRTLLVLPSELASFRSSTEKSKAVECSILCSFSSISQSLCLLNASPSPKPNSCNITLHLLSPSSSQARSFSLYRKLSSTQSTFQSWSRQPRIGVVLNHSVASFSETSSISSSWSTLSPAWTQGICVQKCICCNFICGVCFP